MRKGYSTLIVAGCAIAAGIAMSMRPWHVYAQQKRSASQQVSEMREVETQHVLDLRKDAQIGSTVGREELARQQGFRRVGESPVGQK